ncbi:NADPH:quinone reductase-like Zn-dependent oxidoreductase [Actinocorallia herbida]|uniref:NADPH:quinone reductase-like Zn-dependent oxidoreductase n=1 Tax=Actinocorallia herbida TaxID=58109 RepID=A0A3N1DAY9_9ACTN|nr:NADP-dependent oxidoreductase [Actinocorallia herbida]ROO90697.1 NADPH:quinone reductase-like Zn-dependent oxidoreductase [Actinocorallia herbida]
MRAAVIRAFGGPEVVEIADVAVPVPGPGQVRIRVEAAAVNPVDAAIRAGLLAEAGLMAGRDVIGLGWDVAGVIDAVGEGVSGHRAGERVIGLADRLDVPLGTHAEYVVLDAAAIASAPVGVSPVEAATLPLNASTAAQALDLLDLPEGGTLLVTGAAGAVGGFAVELAAARGLRVVAVADEADTDLVRALGAAWTVPRSIADLAEAVRALVPGGVDGALDAASLGVRALGGVRNRGAFVAVVGGAAPVGLRGIRVANVWITADADRLAELSALAASGSLTLRVADTLPLHEAAQAHARLAKGGLRGRLVLVP